LAFRSGNIDKWPDLDLYPDLSNQLSGRQDVDCDMAEQPLASGWGDQDQRPEASLLEQQEIQIKALAALAQTTRLKTFRLLCQAGKEGLIAGAISKDLAVPHNTLSTHLAILSRAGLIAQVKEGRNIRYFVQQDKIRSLASFLLEGCCDTDQGVHPLSDLRSDQR
jgi:DNA-binding transcriptional ArsR family regulator